MKRGKLFIFSRFFVRLKIGRWTADVPPPQGPTVYICSHHNLRGPLATLCWLPIPARPWVLHVFFDRETCRRQYRDYTFSQRFGLPGPFASALAWAASGYVSALMDSMGGIPVYRGAVTKLGRTFQETVAALEAGDSVLIFPDVDYAAEEAGIGEVYDGFLLVDRFWRKRSDAPVDFVPLRLDTARRHITAAPALRFDRSANQKEELVRVREALRAAINQ